MQTAGCFGEGGFGEGARLSQQIEVRVFLLLPFLVNKVEYIAGGSGRAQGGAFWSIRAQKMRQQEKIL